MMLFMSSPFQQKHLALFVHFKLGIYLVLANTVYCFDFVVQILHNEIFTSGGDQNLINRYAHLVHNAKTCSALLLPWSFIFLVSQS